jgi:hypothetical protein
MRYSTDLHQQLSDRVLTFFAISRVSVRFVLFAFVLFVLERCRMLPPVGKRRNSWAGMAIRVG